LFIDTISGNRLFLPTTGWRSETNGAVDMTTTHGFYWASTLDTASNGDAIMIYSTGVGWNSYNERYGFGLRPVKI